MDDPTSGQAVRWSSSPTAKARNQVMKNVTVILDELAPERIVKRTDELAEVQQYRTPLGCVLQAPNCAISVSWFDGATAEGPLGELHMVLWNGMVKRRGTINQGKGGTVVSDLVFRPALPAPDTVMWKAADGTEYATTAIAQKCLAILEEQMRKE